MTSFPISKSGSTYSVKSASASSIYDLVAKLSLPSQSVLPKALIANYNPNTQELT